MVRVISSLKSGITMTEDDKNITTAVGLLKLFNRRPGLLAAFRNKLMHEPESIGMIFAQGTDYTKTRIEQINNEAELEKQNMDLATTYISNLEKNSPDEYAEFVGTLKTNYEKKSEELKGDINKKIAEIEADMKKNSTNAKKQEEGKKIVENLRDILASLEKGKNMPPDEWKEMAKSWIVPGAALGIAAMDKADRTDVLALAAGSSITNLTINKKLSDATKGVISNLSFGAGLGYDFKDKRLGATI
jgi:chemotaxis protein histidine kinase CheA